MVWYSKNRVAIKGRRQQEKVRRGSKESEETREEHGFEKRMNEF